MKKLFCIFFAIALVACTSAPSETTVQTAIAQTQTIQITIEAGIAQTQTAVVPTAINTPIQPTETKHPTSTSKPFINLSELVLTFEDIDSTLDGYYSPTYIELGDTGLTLDISEEKYSRLFTAINVDTSIFVQIFRIANENLAVKANMAVKNSYLEDGVAIKVPNAIIQKGSPWMVKVDDQLLLGFYQSNFFVLLTIDIIPGLDDETAATFLSLLGQLQQRRISDSGS